VATAAALNRRVEVRDGRWGGATQQVRAEREGQREGGPGQPADSVRPAAARDQQAWAAWRSHAARPDEHGRGKGADRGLRPQCRAAALASRWAWVAQCRAVPLADRQARAAQCQVRTNSN
jgi:hypothetical protein